MVSHDYPRLAACAALSGELGPSLPVTFSLPSPVDNPGAYPSAHECLMFYHQTEKR